MTGSVGKKVLETPVLFLIFNRPETTQQVFNAIREVKPRRLYISADGPRPNVPTDRENCREARRVAGQVDWSCEVHTSFNEKNLGCGAGITRGINWFFNHEPEGIILEDDCMPSGSFFWFCQELLRRYRYDTRVMHIGGNRFLSGDFETNASYYFSQYGHVWGWATWARAWRFHDRTIKKFQSVNDQGYFESFFSNTFERYYRLSKFKQVVTHRVDTWDYQWDFARYINSGLCIIPSRNLVRNIGFGSEATHTSNMDDPHSRLANLELDFPLRHPPFVMRDSYSDSRYFKQFVVDRLLTKVEKKYRSLLTKK